MNTPQDVVKDDLDYIVNNLKSEFSALSGKNLLITGGAGFLGYYLVQSVLHWNRQGPETGPVQVTVYDNYIRGIPDWLQKLSGDPALVLVKHDVTHPLPGDIGDFHYIIHAASIASPTYYRMHPIETMDANINGLRYLLEYALSQQKKNRPVEEAFCFIYKLSEIYGDPTPGNIPTPEQLSWKCLTTGPRSVYDESKRYGETLCVNFSEQYGLPVRVARPFNNYGPGLKITDRRYCRILPAMCWPGKYRDVFGRFANPHILLHRGCNRWLLPGPGKRKKW